MERRMDGQTDRRNAGGQMERKKVVYKVSDSRLKRRKGSGKERIKKKEKDRQTDRQKVRESNKENERERICRATKQNKLVLMSNLFSLNEKGDLGFFRNTQISFQPFLTAPVA